MKGICILGRWHKRKRILWKKGCRRKRRSFYPFFYKAILQNPVYLIADSAAWDYFTKAGTELSSPKEKFDGCHGMMVYNRTRQEKGKKTEFLPMQEWIAAVGSHTGMIPGSIWISVQKL